MDSMVTMFSFKDAVHDHLTFGNRDGCIACAQVQADMALSKRAYYASLNESLPVSPSTLRAAEQHALVA